VVPLFSFSAARMSLIFLREDDNNEDEEDNECECEP
jgi:hypothetical protein